LSVTFGTGTLMASRVPTSCIASISTETINAAIGAAEYYRTCMHTAVTGKKQSAFVVPSASSMLSASISSSSSGAPLLRVDELLKELCVTAFEHSVISNVSSLKFRASSKGKNPGPSELPLLCIIQNSGLFDISVHYPPMGCTYQVIVVHKKKLLSANPATKISAVHVLSRLSVTLDEFLAQSKPSDVEVDLTALPPLATGLLPHGLKPFKGEPFASAAPVATQDRAFMEACEADKSDRVEEPGNKKNRVDLEF
jgi:hypothetical protein